MQELPTDQSQSTNLTAVSENSRTRRNLHQFRYSVTFLALVASAASLALTAYVLFVGNKINNLRQTDTLSLAALNAASTLRRITVESPSFGPVGLCDLDSEENTSTLNNLYSHNGGARLAAGSPVTGINHLYGSLRVSALLADKVHHPIITAHIAEDFNQLEKLESALLIRIYQTREAIYQNAYKTLTKSAAERDTSLISLQISLGGLKESLGDSQVKAPLLTSPIYVNSDGQYKSGIAVPVPNLKPITFHSLASKVVLVDPSQFLACPLVPAQPNDATKLYAPSAVLIEAIYEIKQKGKVITTVKKAACAALGCKQTPASPTALLVTFPHGMPDLFHSLNDIMFYKKWQRQSAWRQAISGDVPGSGSLVPVVDAKLPMMTPGDAMALIIYHWFRQLPTDVDLQKCQNLLSYNLSDLKPVQDAAADSSLTPLDMTKMHAHSLPDMESLPINSCLAKDSSGRASALLDKAIPGGKGQWSISQIFNKANSDSTVNPQPVPPSALPLFVDERGNCNLVGCDGFEESLIREFFNALYETNLSSFESLSTAQLLMGKFSSEKQQVQQKMAIEREELNSMEHRLKLLGEEVFSPESSKNSQLDEKVRQSELLKGQFRSMKTTIAQAEQSLARLNRLIELSSIAIENSTRTANATYELTAHLFSMCKDGFSRLSSLGNHYVIGKKFLFTPVTRAVCESDFIDAAKVWYGQAGKIGNISPWLNKNLTVLKELELGLAQTDPTYKAMVCKLMSIQKLKSSLRSMQPLTIVFNSDSLVTGSSCRPYIYPNYPFVNSVIPSGQLFYYCQQAVQTGANPSVSWSVLVRDVVAFKFKGVSGLPLKATEADWCKQKGQAAGVCPGLACEFQVRTPLPELDGLSLGSYIRNSSKHLVPQLPPVPAEML